MAAPAFFFPGKQGANPQHFTDAGFPDDFGENQEFADILDSPYGRGMLATKPRTGASFRFQDYSWTPLKADAARALEAGRACIGIHRDGITPADLARTDAICGHPITLADGRVWRVASVANFPHRHGLNEQGRWCRMVADKFKNLAAQADGYAVQFFDAFGELNRLIAERPELAADTAARIALVDARDYATEILRVNYYVCPELLDVLAVFSDAAISDIVKASIDLTAILSGSYKAQNETLEISVS